MKLFKKKEKDANLSRSEKIKKEAKSITFIIFGVLVFRSVFFEPFKIPSGSMIPTLMIGDFILVNKFSYGFKVPFSDWVGDPVYLTEMTPPNRGDVIVFKWPRDESLNYIKRVVGLPGDTIQIRDKVVYINGEPISAKEVDAQGYMDDMDDKYRGYNFGFYQVETGEHQHTIQLNMDNYYNSDFGPDVVPEGEYFVMGDNRDFSADSRSWGFVPKGNIKGKAILVWFSLILPFGEHPFKFRPWRIGNLID